MKTGKALKKFNKLQITVAIAAAAAILASMTVNAYFEFGASKAMEFRMTGYIDASFGHLDASVHPTGVWGTTGNPYLIFTNQHLLNLYSLQNSRRLEDINANHVFQISDEFGNPCYIGGASSNDLLDMPSIGSEDFPFISTLRGVKTTNPAKYVTLPSGEVTDTSVIANVCVEAYPGQIDIGLFGNIGYPDPNDPNGTNQSVAVKGAVSDLLLSNIQISTGETGGLKEEHPVPSHYFTTAGPHESNHIGILAGHAQYCTISNVSVYYTKDPGSNKALVEAFHISANDAGTRYTTSGGIIGYYKQIKVGTANLPVSSVGSDNAGAYVGFGLGIVYSEDIWTFMEKNYFAGGAAPNPEYGIQSTFGDELYGANLRIPSGQLENYTFAITTAHASGSIVVDTARVQRANYSMSSSINYLQIPNSNNGTISLSTNASTALCVGFYRENTTPGARTRFQLRSLTAAGATNNYWLRYNATANTPAFTTTGTTNALATWVRLYAVSVSNNRMTEITNAHIIGTGADTRISEALFPPAQYRFMIVHELDASTNLVLTRSSTTATSNTVIQFDNSFFQIGVFTFAHSTQMLNNDRIAKLWRAPGDNQWAVSTTNSYSNAPVNLGIPSKRYTCTQVQYNTGSNQPQHITSQTVYYSTVLDLPASGNMAATSASRYIVSAFPTNSHTPDYRFMIVAEVNGSQYALTKYGATAAAQKIDTSNFVIPESELNNYTFRVLTKRAENVSYPPYTTQAGFRYWCPANLVVDNTAPMQYLCYGDTYPAAPNMPIVPCNATSTTAQLTTYYNDARAVNNADTTTKIEAERPLRIYDSISFMATSVTNSPEGIYLDRNNTTGVNTSFRLQRLASSGTTDNHYLRFTEGDGFTFATSTTGTTPATAVKIYAVRITNNTGNPAESPVTVPYEKEIYTAAPVNAKTYDMRENVLFYTGNASANNPAQKYTYTVRSLESLGWSDNNGAKITHADTTLKMADPTSYYYLNSVFSGVKEGIPAPAGIEPPFHVIKVPLASIGFTVNGHGVYNGADQQAKVFVIVASDPSQLVDQTINISYFPYTTTPANPAANAQPTSFSYSGTRQIIGSFALPPIPGATAQATTPIYINDSGSTYTAYPNLNTILVAYEFTVPVSRYARTYYLEASKGSANFVYLSAERTASDDNNPTHKNDAKISVLNTLDYVVQRNNMIATVGSANYSQSMTAPYFGLTRNPANLSGTAPGLDVLKVLQAKAFTYSIFRSFDTGQQLHTIYIDVAVPAPPPPINDAQLKTVMQGMNFNFAEWSYADVANNRMVFSDKVETAINNRAVNWTLLADLYP